MTDAATEAREAMVTAVWAEICRQCNDGAGHAEADDDGLVMVNADLDLGGIVDAILALPALTADRDRIRGEAFEEAARVCEAQSDDFLSPEYAIGQPLSSFSERYACAACASAIRALAQPGPVDDGWRDIAGAEKRDRHQVLLWRPGWQRADIGSWNEGRRTWSVRGEPVRPTMFHALPTPPASTGGEVGK